MYICVKQNIRTGKKKETWKTKVQNLQTVVVFDK